MTHELSQQEKENIAKEWIAAEAATKQAASAERRKEKRKEYDDKRKKETASLYVRLPTADATKAARLLLKKIEAWSKASGKPFEKVAETLITRLDEVEARRLAAASSTV